MDKKIRTFGRSELAQQYFPNLKPMTAWEKFKEWLDINPRLRPLLSLSRRTYTPAEVQLIYSELGEPWPLWQVCVLPWNMTMTNDKMTKLKIRMYYKEVTK